MKTKQILYIITLAVMSLTLFSCQPKAEEAIQPNIVFIYLDDLGYGDVTAYDADAKVPTPHIDAMAQDGVRFTNGYASSATCTPSRYALLTGQYPWRNKDAHILAGSAPLIIDTEMITLPKMLKAEGYQTSIVGKWHLGLGDGNMDWNKSVTPGPNEVGFDESYIMAATQDRVPTVFIDNGKVENLDPNDPIYVNYKKNFEGEPTAISNPEMLKLQWHHGHNNSIVNGIPRIGYVKGGKSAYWNDSTMADHFLAKAIDYIKRPKDKPFFLYYALQEPHVPRIPQPQWAGKSGMGARGDVIMQADWYVGQIMKTLEEEGLAENTIVFFSSDNGPVLNDGYEDEADTKWEAKNPTGGLRGGKYSLFEAGTRVPFIVYWKGKIQPKVSDALVCQMDMYSSLAKLIGSEQRGEDSQDILEALTGKSDMGRQDLIIEATSRTAYRNGDWAMIPPYNGPAVNTKVNNEMGNDKEFQLYNLKDDIGQQNNLAKENPEKLKELYDAFIAIRGENYSKTKKLELK